MKEGGRERESVHERERAGERGDSVTHSVVSVCKLSYQRELFSPKMDFQDGDLSAAERSADRDAHRCVSQTPLACRLLIDFSLFTFQIRNWETELSASPEEETHQRQTSPLGKSYLHS